MDHRRKGMGDRITNYPKKFGFARNVLHGLI